MANHQRKSFDHTGLDETLNRVGNLIGRSRIVVLIAVAAVLLVAFSLFALGSIHAVISVFEAWKSMFTGDLESVELTVTFLETITVMLKAVFFYLIGVGLYSLFISPLNIAIALGIETLNDLETKILNVVIVIMAVTFLEHFTRWRESWMVLQFGIAFALVVAAIVLFEFLSHYSSEASEAHDPELQRHSKRELFEHDVEQHETPESDK